MLQTPIGQLVLYRLRDFMREPEAVFWTYGFPLMMTVLLGLAFRSKPAEKLAVEVIAGPHAAAVAERLAADGRFEVRTVSAEQAARDVRIGKAPVAVESDGDRRYRYRFDADRPEGAAARFAVDDALQRAAGRADAFKATDDNRTEPGGRYVDFLVPGLLGMGVMGGGLWGLGFAIVDMRLRKLLKRFLATPMRKADFLASLMLARLAFLLPEIVILLAFAHLAFGFRVYGSWLDMAALILLGAVAFAGIGLLAASRAKTVEAISGLMNLIMLPQWLLSGIFFSSERFPEVLQPAIRLLPLTALLNGLRAVMLEGQSLTERGADVLILAGWAVGSFLLAHRLFRWHDR